MKSPRFLTLLLLTASPLAAQTPVWQDDFGDGVINPMWSQSVPLGWTVNESNGALNMDILAGLGYAGYSTVEADLPAQSGALELEVQFQWSGEGWVDVWLSGPGPSSAGMYLAVGEDSWIGGGYYQEAEVLAGSTWSGPLTIPTSGTANLVLSRDSAGNWSYDLTDGGSTVYGSGSLGQDSGTLDAIRLSCSQLYANAVLLCAPVRFDFVELRPVGTTPVATFIGSCPGTGTLDVTNATPGGLVAFGHGTPGITPLTGGACPAVVVPLEAPTRFATRIADNSGQASVTGFVPSAACGAVSALAMDVATCTMSNLIAF